MIIEATNITKPVSYTHLINASFGGSFQDVIILVTASIKFSFRDFDNPVVDVIFLVIFSIIFVGDRKIVSNCNNGIVTSDNTTSSIIIGFDV